MRPLNGFFRQRWKWVLTGAFSVLAACLALSYTPGLSLSRRPANENEKLMYFFAQNLGAAALCERISWAASRRHGLQFGGVSLWRSDCYERVAETNKDTAVCWQVRPLVDFNPVSPGYSALACRRRTLSGYTSGMALGDDALVQTFQQLGYDADSFYVEGVIEPATRIRNVYLGLVRNAAAITRAQRLLMQANPGLQAGDAGYLANLTAIGTADPRWCGHILPGEGSSQLRASLRDWCYFTVAYNTLDPRICALMKPAPAEDNVIAAEAAGVQPDIAEQLSLHAECARIGEIVKGEPRPHYGPQVPPDPAQAQRIIAAVGVVMPPAREWPQPELAAYYQQILVALSRRQPHNSARDAARNALVRRLMGLHTSVG